MKMLITATCSTFLICTLGFSASQQQPNQTSTQNDGDVPKQGPKTSNPDVGKQRHPAPAPVTGDSQQQRTDVPQGEPKTSNPDVGKQRHPAPKKSKPAKSTGSSTQS